MLLLWAVACVGGWARCTQGLPQRLGERVSRMLTRIEKELDVVESTIGQRMHVLDTDADGEGEGHN